MTPKILYHTAPKQFRSSIELNGLDPHHDMTGYGAVYLSRTPLDGEGDHDVWRVLTSGLDVTDDESTPGFEGDWFMTRKAIPPKNLELLDAEDIQYIPLNEDDFFWTPNDAVRMASIQVQELPGSDSGVDTRIRAYDDKTGEELGELLYTVYDSASELQQMLGDYDYVTGPYLHSDRDGPCVYVDWFYTDESVRGSYAALALLRMLAEVPLPVYADVVNPRLEKFLRKRGSKIAGSRITSYGAVDPGVPYGDSDPGSSVFSQWTRLAADVRELAAKAYDQIMARPDVQNIYQLAQEWEDKYQSERKPGEPAKNFGKMMTPTQDETPVQSALRAAHNAHLLADQIQYAMTRIRNTYPAGYKLMPNAVKTLKTWAKQAERMEGEGTDVQWNRNPGEHVGDIYGQAGQLLNELRQLNKVPEGMDVNRMNFEEVQDWLYNYREENSAGMGYKTNDVVYELPNNWKIVRITDKDDLATEGELMGHCVGGYCDLVYSGSSLIYSLRDPKNEPHATIEINGQKGLAPLTVPNEHGWAPSETDPNTRHQVDGWEIEQIQGKSNREPVPEYQAMIREWFESLQSQGVELRHAHDYNDHEIDDINSLVAWYDYSTRGRSDTEVDEYGISSRTLVGDITRIVEQIVEYLCRDSHRRDYYYDVDEVVAALNELLNRGLINMEYYTRAYDAGRDILTSEFDKFTEYNFDYFYDSVYERWKYEVENHSMQEEEGEDPHDFDEWRQENDETYHEWYQEVEAEAFREHFGDADRFLQDLLPGQPSQSPQESYHAKIASSAGREPAWWNDPTFTGLDATESIRSEDMLSGRVPILVNRNNPTEFFVGTPGEHHLDLWDEEARHHSWDHDPPFKQFIQSDINWMVTDENPNVVQFVSYVEPDWPAQEIVETAGNIIVDSLQERGAPPLTWEEVSRNKALFGSLTLPKASRPYPAHAHESPATRVSMPYLPTGWKRIAPGDYESIDGRYLLYQIPGVSPPAWNVEDLSIGSMLVDGAASARDAIALMDAYTPIFPRANMDAFGSTKPLVYPDTMDTTVNPYTEGGGTTTPGVPYLGRGGKAAPEICASSGDADILNLRFVQMNKGDPSPPYQNKITDESGIAAYVGEEQVGHVTYSIEPKGEYLNDRSDYPRADRDYTYVHWLWVEPEWRGQGISKQLLNQVKEATGNPLRGDIINEFVRGVLDSKTSRATMFHATSRDRVDSILQNGLLQSKNNQDYDTLVWESSPGIYFFESYDNALKIGRMKFGYDAVVLAVDVSDIPIQLDPDFIPLTPENDPFAGMPNVSPNFDKRKMLKDKLRNQWTDKTGIPRAWRTFADVSPDRISIAPENARITAIQNESMAADPNFVANWIAENGPYVYHGIRPTRAGMDEQSAIQSILAQGILPDMSDPLERPDENDEGEWTEEHEEWWHSPRPGHVFLVINSRDAYGPIVAKVDLRLLDPAKIKPDDDYWRDSVSGDTGENTLGEHMNQIGWGDNPEDTHAGGFEYGVIAYEGAIPPTAIEGIYHIQTIQKVDPSGGVTFEPEVQRQYARISATWTDVRMHTEFHEDLDVYTTQAWVDDVPAGEITVDAEGFVINAWVLPEFADEHLGKAMMMRFEEDIGFYPTPREWASLLSKVSMAFAPDDWDYYIRGRPLYHVTELTNVPSILKSGIWPASVAGMTNRDKDFWTPRAGHVYLWTDSQEASTSPLWQTLKEPALIEIDPSHLDPKLFKADEDFAHMMYYHPYELMDVPENDEGDFDYSDVSDYGYGQPPAADRSLRDYWTAPKNIGLGEWADRAGLDSHDITIDSANMWNRIAYEGPIPPLAIKNIEMDDPHGDLVKWQPPTKRVPDTQLSLLSGLSEGVDAIVEKVRSVLTPDLLHPKYKGRDQAHCYAATEAVYHLLGGPASAYRPKQLTLGPETSHWWLEGPNGEIVDPTHDQFEEPIDYTLGTGKGFLTREPSKRANEIIQRVMKTSMALRPEDFTKLPETLYHVAQRDDLGNIMVEGLRPASELGRSRDVGFFAPRPGHVYMYTDISEAMDSGRWNEEEIGWDDEGNEVDVRRNDPVMLAINKNLLDPAKFKADEDYLFHRDHLYDYGEAPQSYPKERQMGYNSLGEWAQEKGLDDPQVTWDSAQNNYTLAYEGTIPPDAITILDHLQQDQEFATL